MKNSLIAFIFFSTALFAQDVKFYGEARPGGIVIGVGRNIAGASLDKTKLQIDSSGAFVFGFDRNAKGKFTLKIYFQNKKTENYVYQIEQREYDEQRLTLARKYVTPPKKVSKRIKRENELMKVARAKVGKLKEALFIAGFTDPVDSVDIRSTFGVQRILNGKPSNIHNGLDYGAEVGDSIYAITDGIVRIAGQNFFYNGNFVLLDHGQGLTSVYLHMSKIIAKDGAKVKKGELIGLAGSTGRATGPHLHLGVQWYKKRIDPMSLFSLNLPPNEGI